jgi:hypothetical protein
MDRCNVVTNTVCTGFARLADWFRGCSHGRTTFPITLRDSAQVDKTQGMQTDTYVVCLECGRHLTYDWTRMRMTSKRPAWPIPALLPNIVETNKGSR